MGQRRRGERRTGGTIVVGIGDGGKREKMRRNNRWIWDRGDGENGENEDIEWKE